MRKQISVATLGGLFGKRAATLRYIFGAGTRTRYGVVPHRPGVGDSQVVLIEKLVVQAPE